MTDKKTNVNKVVADFLAVYQNTPHATTGVSPARLLLNRNMRCQLDLLFPPTPAMQNQELHGKVHRSQEKQKIANDKTAMNSRKVTACMRISLSGGFQYVETRSTYQSCE